MGAAFILLASLALAANSMLFRIDLNGRTAVWSKDRPRSAGSLLLFHSYPTGLLVSVKRAEVRRVVAVPLARAAAAARSDEIDVGPTGDGSQSLSAVLASNPAAEVSAGPRPGERRDGTALLNPSRPYRPDWDSKQVPGASIPFPVSPNDYLEGYSYPRPPANAILAAPGAAPMMPPGNGEVPKGPQD